MRYRNGQFVRSMLLSRSSVPVVSRAGQGQVIGTVWVAPWGDVREIELCLIDAASAVSSKLMITCYLRN